jgi:hypothetical protein
MKEQRSVTTQEAASIDISEYIALPRLQTYGHCASSTKVSAIRAFTIKYQLTRLLLARSKQIASMQLSRYLSHGQRETSVEGSRQTGFNIKLWK